MSISSHPILLAALDLDDTLLNSSGEVTDYTRKVLSEASDRGVVVIPATGRPLASLPPVVAKQPWVRYALTSNGAAVWDLGNDPLGCVYSRYANAAQHETSQPECIVRRCFPVETAREVYEAFRGLPGGLNIFSDGPAHRLHRGPPAQRRPLHHPAGAERVDEPPRPCSGEVLYVLPLCRGGPAVSAPLHGHPGR